MPSPYDLIQLINSQFAYTQKDTIEEINELISDIDKDPKKFTYELSEELSDWCKTKNKCPLCGEEIVQIGVDYESSEYFGYPTNEKIVRYACDSPSCSYIVD